MLGCSVGRWVKGLGCSVGRESLVFGGWAWEGVAGAGDGICRDKPKGGIGRQRVALGAKSGIGSTATFACFCPLCLPCRPLPPFGVPCCLPSPAPSFFGKCDEGARQFASVSEHRSKGLGVVLDESRSFLAGGIVGLQCWKRVFQYVGVFLMI